MPANPYPASKLLPSKATDRDSVTDTMEQHVTYSATLKVEGSAGTWDKYNLVVDTGSPMTWFYSEACTAPACKALEKLLSGSDILEEETPFHYETKDGDMLKGNWAVDAIQVDGLAGDASEGRGSRWGIKTPTVFGEYIVPLSLGVTDCRSRK